MLLKNNGQPQAITVFNQRVLDYTSKAYKGKFDSFHIIIGMHRENGPDAEAQKFRVNEDEKVILYYKNGRYQRREIVPIDKSFVVTHYPHIVGAKFGINQYSEREYNILCGQVASIENEEDAKGLFQRYGYLDEVDEKGEIIRENRWAKDKEYAEKKMGMSYSERVDMSKVPKHYESYDEPGITPKERRVEGLVEHREMTEKEKGEKEV